MEYKEYLSDLRRQAKLYYENEGSGTYELSATYKKRYLLIVTIKIWVRDLGERWGGEDNYKNKESLSRGEAVCEVLEWKAYNPRGEEIKIKFDYKTLEECI